MEDNKSLLRKVAVLESLNKPDTHNFCIRCLQEIAEPQALIEKFSLIFKLFKVIFLNSQ